ncbi:MAG: oligosaccharide flippase family protein, partial [Rhodospirillales bacterium]|nr:oligosaccharide flippase family protein [Rhodospirillales bacterium]
MPSTASIAHRVAVGAGWLMGWRLISRILGFASTLTLARLLVPADFGLIAMATSCAAVVDGLSQLRVQDALIRNGAGDRDSWDTAFTLQAARGLLTATVIVVATPATVAWFGEPRLAPVLLVLAGLAFLAGFENVATVEFRRTLRFGRQFVLLAVPRLAGLATTIPLAFAWRSYWALIAGMAALRLSTLVLSYLLKPHRPRVTLAAWHGLIGFSLWAWASTIASMVWERSDALILGGVFGPQDLGTYLLAFEIALLPITELVAPATDALFPGFAAARAEGSDVLSSTFLVIATLLIGVVPAALALSASAAALVPVILGPRWELAAPLIAILSPVCIFAPVSYTCGTMLMASGYVRQHFLAMALASVVKIGVVSLAARTQDLLLTSAVLVACVAIESLAFLVQLRRLGRLDRRRWLPTLGRIALAAAVTGTLAVLSGQGWKPASPQDPTGGLLTGAALGFGTCATFWLTLAAAWWYAGRPDGAERRLVVLLAGVCSGLGR